MIDFDLSKLYGVETKRLKEQVKRNISRFPKDFPRGASATMPSTRLPTTKQYSLKNQRIPGCWRDICCENINGKTDIMNKVIFLFLSIALTHFR